MQDNNDLSERELEILRLVATGASNKQIAQQLFISPNTVKVHLKNIFAKIGAASRTEAAMHAVQSGMVPGGGSGNGESLLDVQTISSGTFPSVSSQPSAADSARRWQAILWIAPVIFISLLMFGAASLARINRLATNDLLTGSTSGSTNELLTGRWSVHSSLPTARSGFGAVAYENNIYLVGGTTEEGVTGELEFYDPESDSWKELMPKPTPAGDVSATLIGGKIYVPGGRLSTGGMTNLMEIYIINENRWEEGPKVPAALSAAATVAHEGKLYLFGGWDGHKYLDSAFVFDPSNREWVELSPMPTPRAFLGAAVAGGRIYVIGGRNESGEVDVNEVFSPVPVSGENDWSIAAPLPVPRSAMGIVTVADTIHLVGGVVDGSDNVPSLIYLPSTNTWNSLDPSYSQSSSGLGLVPVELNIYVLGGKTQEEVSAQNQSYRALFVIALPFVK